jgi:hypothetical protein
MPSIWFIARMGLDDHGLSHPRKAPGRLVWQASEVRWWNVSWFSVGAGTVLCTLGCLCSHRQLWRIEVQHVIGLYLENCRQTFMDTTCFLFVLGTRFYSLSVPFGCTLYMSVLRIAPFEHALRASTGHPSVAVECLESLRVHVRGWRPAFMWGLSWLSPRRFCSYSAAASLFMLFTVCPCCTDMRRWTTGMRSEQCVVRRFRRCANIIVYLHKPR